MFNSIFYRTPNISIPQYSHQSQNIANINCTIKCNIGKNINNNLRNIIEYILFNKEFNIVKTKINFVSKVLKNQLGLKEIKKIYEN